MANIFDVADWFLSKEAMTHKKVQKLTYYYKAWGWALYEKDMLPGYDFQAWIHGPVSPELYQKYKGNYWKDLPKKPDNSGLFDEKELSLLSSVWETYGDMSANALEVQTHLEEPWKKARAGLPESMACETIISWEDMKNYYQSVYSGDQSD